MDEYNFINDEDFELEDIIARRSDLQNKVSSADSAMINAYLDGRLSLVQFRELESRVLNNSKLEDLFDQKQRERDFILQMIPDQVPGLNTLSQIKNEIHDLNASVLEETKVPWWDRIWQWLNRPFIDVKL